MSGADKNVIIAFLSGKLSAEAARAALDLATIADLYAVIERLADLGVRRESAGVAYRQATA